MDTTKPISHWRHTWNELRVKGEMIIGSIPAAIAVITDPPRARGIQLQLKNIERWEATPSTKQADGRHTLVVFNCTAWQPERKHHYVDGDGELRESRIEGHRYDCRIAINVARERIDRGLYTSGHLFHEEHQGSGMIGVMLFAAPVLLLSTPILYPICKYRAWQERRDGMSRHGRAILDALAPDLTPDDTALLARALRNTWSQDQAMERTVTFVEAQQLLQQCTLRRTEFAPHKFDGSITGAAWFDGHGDCVARDTRNARATSEQFSIRVLGTEFTGGQARMLLECYRTQTVRHLGNDAEAEDDDIP
ncbi:hypothetical protein HYV74_03980 [Candidatus Uhrbacteria bacterium]|nr:hypothetical protein [Candidatus Uhrbacteria bacterium]